MNVAGLKVVVVGGATGGCATALLLARAGASVELVERVAEPRAIGAGIALAANGLAVLESLGLGRALAVAHELHGVRITDASGRTLLDPPRSALRLAMLRRSTLQAMLLDAVAAEGRINARFGVEVVEATRDGRVTLRAMSTGITEALDADLVVGADGVHSRVRECGAFGGRVRATGIQYLRVLVDAGLAIGVEAWTAAGVFGSFPVDDGTYMFASCGTPPCREAVAARDLDALGAAWSRAYPPSAPLFAAVGNWDRLIFNEVVRVDCDRWADGRMVLLGDAAHAMAPNLGQGANSALVDASVLLDELRGAPDVSQALARYEKRRKPAVKRVADTAEKLGRLSEVTHPLGRWMRDRVLAPVINALPSERATKVVLQEEPDRLLEIGQLR